MISMSLRNVQSQDAVQMTSYRKKKKKRKKRKKQQIISGGCFMCFCMVLQDVLMLVSRLMLRYLEALLLT